MSWLILHVSFFLLDRPVIIWKRKCQNLVRYDPQSAYVAHILNNIHEYESINNTMPLIQQVNKSPYMNSLEQFYIHLYS